MDSTSALHSCYNLFKSILIYCGNNGFWPILPLLDNLLIEWHARLRWRCHLLLPEAQVERFVQLVLVVIQYGCHAAARLGRIRRWKVSPFGCLFPGGAAVLLATDRELALAAPDAVFVEITGPPFQTDPARSELLLLLTKSTRRQFFLITRQRIQRIASIPAFAGRCSPHWDVFRVHRTVGMGWSSLNRRSAVDLIAAIFKHLSDLQRNENACNFLCAMDAAMHRNTFPPLPVDPSEEARDEPKEEASEAVLLALLCWLILLLLLCVWPGGMSAISSWCSSSIANNLCSFSSCWRCWKRACNDRFK